MIFRKEHILLNSTCSTQVDVFEKIAEVADKDEIALTKAQKRKLLQDCKHVRQVERQVS